jgi:flagellar assembly factor FliW
VDEEHYEEVSSTPASIKNSFYCDRAMRFETANFGQLQIDPESILLFPDGLVGFEQYRHWVLLSENDDDAVGWLQSLNDPELVFSVITPHRFVPNYSLRIDRAQFAALPWSSTDESIILGLVSQRDGEFSVNLKAPVIINLQRGLGRQVVVADDQPLQYALSGQPGRIRKSA